MAAVIFIAIFWTGESMVCDLARVLNYWILAPMHSVWHRLVIVTQCIYALIMKMTAAN